MGLIGETGVESQIGERALPVGQALADPMDARLARRPAGAPAEEAAERARQGGGVNAGLLTGDWERYAQARSRALQTEAGRIAAYDPMPYWILIQQPVLVLYGAEDERDNVPVMESVRRLEHAF